MENEINLPSTWYVYTYALPDDTVFYVGKGKGNRINHHEREAANGCDCKKCQTIRDIWASGNPVKKRIVFETLVEKEALTKEAELIREYSGEHLTNTRVNPGLGNNEPEQTTLLQGKTVFTDTPPEDLYLFRAFPHIENLFMQGQLAPLGMTITFDFTFKFDTETGQVVPVQTINKK